MVPKPYRAHASAAHGISSNTENHDTDLNGDKLRFGCIMSGLRFTGGIVDI
jgi:hypothetical protein